MDVTNQIIKYENDELSVKEEIKLVAELIKSGLCWKLQGHYGRLAQSYIDNGAISREGVII